MTKFKLNTNSLFYILVVYILLQFIWWEILLVKQNKEIHAEKEKILALGISDPNQLKNELSSLQKKESKNIYMIVGEGTIFLIIISIGIIRVHKVHKREKEITAQQKNFLLSVSHELKTPLATSKLSLQTLLSRDLDKEMQYKILTNTLQENERLTQLIENILMSARLDDSADANTLLINKERVNISEFIQEIILKAFTPVQQKRIHLNLEAAIFLTTDKAVFPSIIINLVENALKYSPADAQVEVCLHKSERINLSIKDKGPGIADLEKEKVFQKFYRLGNEETRISKGTGLGLFIVKKTVEMHGGEIVVKNNAPCGSIIEVNFVVSAN
jgi:two-component system, OmpR family, sensor histidine kinase CiaH